MEHRIVNIEQWVLVFIIDFDYVRVNVKGQKIAFRLDGLKQVVVVSVLFDGGADKTSNVTWDRIECFKIVFRQTWRQPLCKDAPYTPVVILAQGSNK